MEMRIATETPDPPPGATLWVEIPLEMSEADRSRQFEEPLRAWLAEQNSNFTLRCFALPELDHRPAGIGIEVQATEIGTLAFAVEKIVELGAPLTTSIEIDFEKGTLQMSLADAVGE